MARPVVMVIEGWAVGDDANLPSLGQSAYVGGKFNLTETPKRAKWRLFVVFEA